MCNYRKYDCTDMRGNSIKSLEAPEFRDNGLTEKLAMRGLLARYGIPLIEPSKLRRIGSAVLRVALDDDDSTESLDAPEFRDDDDGLELGTFGCWGEDSPRAIATAILCAVGLIAVALSVALFVEWLLR